MATPTLLTKKIAPAPEAAGAKPADATPAPPKLKRRPFLVALAVVFIALGALLGGYLTTLGDTHPVVVMRHDVLRGGLIQRDDLIEARINTDPALKTVPAAHMDMIIGKRARVDMAAGGLVSLDNLTDTPIPADGQTIVGIALGPAQMPGEPLTSGDQVRIINTPRQQDDPPATIPDGIRATVVSQRTIADTGQIVVDVTVPLNDGASLAALVATGRIALLLDGAN